MKYILVLSVLSLAFAPTSPKRGLALANEGHKEDLDTLGVAWFYNWNLDCHGDSRCIPMARAMQTPDTCPPTLLVGNEPNAREPYGAPVTPADAVNKVLAIQAKCPNTQLVVGNVSADDWGNGTGLTWLYAFLRGYWLQTGHRFGQSIGAHCYAAYAVTCTTLLAKVKAIGYPLWVTEFGLLQNNPEQMRAMVKWLEANADRYAVYTARQIVGAGYSLPFPALDLINADGSLSPNGKVYASP